MSGVPMRQWADWPAWEPDRHPETKAWIARIQAVRSSGEFPVALRRCVGPCERTLPLGAFGRNRSKALGRRYECRDCDAERKRAGRARQKLAVARAILRVAS